MRKLILLTLKKLANIFSGSFIGKIPGIFKLFKFVYMIVAPKEPYPIVVEQNKMYLDFRDEDFFHLSFLTNKNEKREVELVKKIVKPGMVFVDIGAHIGYYTLIAAKLVRDEGKVYSFEPEARNFDLLIKNIRANNYTNVIPFKKAVSNKTGETNFFVNKDHSRGHSFAQSQVLGKSNSIRVETITLDNFFNSGLVSDKVDFIKIDTEGAEGLIIEGAKKLLEKKDLKILMEFYPQALKANGTDPIKLLNELQDLNFTIRVFNKEYYTLQNLEIGKIMDLCEKTNTVNLFLEK